MLAYVGGYSSPDRRGRAPGITTWDVTAADAPWTLLSTTHCFDNPSLLQAGPGGGTVYAVHGGRTLVSAFARVPPSPDLRFLGHAESGGLNPVDVGVWPGRRALVVVNYGGGTVAVLPLGTDAAASAPHQVIALERDGVAGPSLPHGVTFDPAGHFVLVPDKGLDCVFVFALAGDRLEPAGYGACAPGSGPRHLAFHPALPMAYAVCELACTVQPFRWEPCSGGLEPLVPVATVPSGDLSGCAAAEIAVSLNGRTLYVSTRGHDSISWFSLDAMTGEPTFQGNTSCLGREPRLFVISPDGETLLCANQESDAIVAFPLAADGSLGKGRVVAEVGSPSAICFVDAP